MKKAKVITGSNEFSEFFKLLSEDDPFKIEINNARKILLEDCVSGEKIEHDKWPNYYMKYKITNLWRYELQDGKRLVYTILGSSNGFTVSIIETFVSHTKYEKRFDY